MPLYYRTGKKKQICVSSILEAIRVHGFLDIIFGWSQVTSLHLSWGSMNRGGIMAFLRKRSCRDHIFFFNSRYFGLTISIRFQNKITHEYNKGRKPCLIAPALTAGICNCFLHVYIPCVGITWPGLRWLGSLTACVLTCFSSQYKDGTGRVLSKTLWAQAWENPSTQYLYKIYNLTVCSTTPIASNGPTRACQKGRKHHWLYILFSLVHSPSSHGGWRGGRELWRQ